jgi:hypothetical protein
MIGKIEEQVFYYLFWGSNGLEFTAKKEQEFFLSRV